MIEGGQTLKFKDIQTGWSLELGNLSSQNSGSDTRYWLSFDGHKTADIPKLTKACERIPTLAKSESFGQYSDKVK